MRPTVVQSPFRRNSMLLAAFAKFQAFFNGTAFAERESPSI